MTYKVFSGTLNPTQSVSLCVLDMALLSLCAVLRDRLLHCTCMLSLRSVDGLIKTALPLPLGYVKKPCSINLQSQRFSFENSRKEDRNIELICNKTSSKL